MACQYDYELPWESSSARSSSPSDIYPHVSLIYAQILLDSLPIPKYHHTSAFSKLGEIINISDVAMLYRGYTLHTL